MKQLKTKTGKTFRVPSVFVLPKIELDVEALREANQRYPLPDGGAGLDQIDGVTLNLKDHRQMWGGLSQGTLSSPDLKNTLIDRLKIINPGLGFLVRGNDADRERMRFTGLFESETIRMSERITNSDSTPSEKVGQIVNEVYPRLHAGLVNSILKYQIDAEADIVAFPTVPITSTRHFDAQIAKVREMIRTSRLLLDRLFSGTVKQRDTMSAIDMDARFLAERKYSIEIADALLSQDAEHVGVIISNLDRSNETQVQNVLDFVGMLFEGIRGLGKNTPIHLMNVDQTGYLAFCYGASTLTMPLASDPFFYSIRHKKDVTPTRKGVYYYPSKMSYVPYDKLLDLTRASNYRLPCHCFACEQYQTVFNAESAMDFNKFRRIHDALYKNIENKMLRDPKIPFPEAMRDLLARCRPAWTQYMPTRPFVAF